MTMGERLRGLRLARNVSQEEVARHIGITRSAYSHYEINNRQPVYDTMIKLAAYYDVTLDYIIGGATGTPQSDAPDTTEILRLLKRMNHEQRKKSIHMLTDMIRQDPKANSTTV